MPAPSTNLGPAKDATAGISPGTGGVMPPAQSDPLVGSPIGTGSRPRASMYPIKTSAPANAQTLGRDPGGSLKQTT